MSFIATHQLFNDAANWKPLFQQPFMGLKIYQNDERIQFCDNNDVRYVFEMNSVELFDCENILDKFYNTGSMIALGINKAIVFNKGSHVISLYDVTDSKWVLGLDHRTSTLYITDEQSRDENISETSFYIPNHASLRLDEALFNDTIRVKVDRENRLMTCESIITLFEGDSGGAHPPFVLVTDSAAMRFDSSVQSSPDFPWSLSDWISFCGLSPVTVYTWELSPLSWDDPLQLNNDGFCNVKYVTHGHYHESNNRKSVSCLSDAMSEDYSILMGDWGANSEVVFVSAFGLPSLLAQSVAYHSELVAVIRSFMILHQTPSTSSAVLHVRSLATDTRRHNKRYLQSSLESKRHVCQCDPKDCSFQSTLIDLVLVFESDVESEDAWNALTRRLTCLSHTYRPLEILSAFQGVFIDEVSGEVKNLCSQGNLYMCGVTEKQVLMVETGDSTVDAYIKELIAQQRTDFDMSLSIIPDREVDRVRPQVHTLTDGDVYVLVYILPEHRGAADAIVEQLQAGAVYDDYMKRTAHVYIKYLIIPVSRTDQADSNVCSSVDLEGNTNEMKCIEASAPSMRVVVEHASHVINDIVDVQDIVFVLVGLEALVSFPQPAAYPGTSHNNPEEFETPYRGIVPNCMYGSNSFYRLSANIMVSCNNCNKNERKTHTLMDFDFHAFVGIGSKVLNMLNAVQDQVLYRYSGDGMVHYLLREYAWNHPLGVALDRENIAFESDLARQLTKEDLQRLGSMAVGSVLDAGTVTADLDKLFHAYYHDTIASAADDIVNKMLVDKLANVSNSRRLVAPSGGAGDQCQIVIEQMNHEVMTSFNECLLNHRWFAGVFNLVVFAEIGKHCLNFQWYVNDLAYRFFQISRYSKYWNYYISHDEYRYTILLLQHYLRIIHQSYTDCADEIIHQLCRNVFGNVIDCQCSGEFLSSMDRMEVAVSTAQAALYQETASYDEMIRAFRVSLNPELFSVIQRRRQEWQAQRAVLRQKLAGSLASNDVTIRFATFASKRGPELESLILSAQISLINLQVIGLGTNFTDYSQKINGYFHYLQSVDDDEIVVLIDAYDVLLLPRARQIGSVLSQSETPIMFCAESGIYPEFAGAFLYHRGSINSHHNEYTQRDHMVQKFLNSGCMAGRAGQLKHMFSFAHMLSYVFRDDQQVLIHYMLQNPDMISLDTERQMFLTTFKMNSVVKEVSNWDITEVFSLHLSPTTIEGALEQPRASSIGIIHCNNKANGNFYNVYMQQIQEYVSLYYSGEDGPGLLLAVNAFHDGQLALAKNYLTTETVSRNRTSVGGSNQIGDSLLSLIEERDREAKIGSIEVVKQ